MLKIVLFLILGAIVNVAVAWGLTSQRSSLLSGLHDAAEAHEWVLGVIDEYGFSNRGVFDEIGTRYNRIRTFTCPPGAHMAPIAPYVTIQHQSVGWPSLSLCGSKLVYLSGSLSTPIGAPTKTGITRVEHRQALPLPGWQSVLDHQRTGFLPCQPIWPGFAINTVFYAVILWLLFAAPFALRRRWRIKRGLCPKCAYDLRGSASQTCPECGKTINPATSQT